MTFSDMALLFVSAVIGGGLNSVAGGGSFFVFPALVFTGVPTVSANATNTVALWPGSLASLGAYWRELMRQRSNLWLFIAISIVGGLAGALLLLRTNDETFAGLVPYLLLVATLIFALSGPVIRWLRARRTNHGPPSVASRLGVALLQLVTAIYGGFFGGGIGILMLATLALMGMEDIHEMNAIKVLLATIINGVAVVTFVAAGVVHWPSALVLIAGAIVGGYGGAALARRLDGQLVRRFVIVVGTVMTVYFFLR